MITSALTSTSSQYTHSATIARGQTLPDTHYELEAAHRAERRARRGRLRYFLRAPSFRWAS